MRARDPFVVLGVSRGATPEEVKQAYRRRALETHPDRGGSKERFEEVAAAYRQICSGDFEASPDLKARYRELASELVRGVGESLIDGLAGVAHRQARELGARGPLAARLASVLTGGLDLAADVGREKIRGWKP